MVKLFNAYFPGRMVLLFFSDLVLVVLALLAAVFWGLGSDGTLFLMYEQGATKIAMVSALVMVSFYFCDLYSSTGIISSREAFARLIQSLGVACVVQALIYFVLPPFRLLPRVLVTGVGFIGIVLVAWRKLFFTINQLPVLAQRVAFLGDNHLAMLLASEIRNRPELGLRAIGFVSSLKKAAGGVDGLPRLGPSEEITALAERHRIEQIFVTMDDRRGHLPVEDLLYLKRKGVIIRNGPDVYEGIHGSVPVQSLRPSWLLFSKGYQPSPAVLLYKRVFSIVFSAVGLLFTLPWMVLIAIAIRLDSRGPAILRQERIGMSGKNFTLYKFRSMYISNKSDNHTSFPRAEGRAVTRVGRFLRRYRLDELPQLYNILKGEMAFVGPRPFVPVEELEFAQQIPFYTQRWSIKPGATGWAQINQGYCTTVEENVKKLGYDLFYIKNMSIGLDTLIVFRTAKTLLLGRGAR